MSLAVTAVCSPNLAFIKYWGNRDDALRLPMNGSISMNLAGLMTTTEVEWRDGLQSDALILDDTPQSGEPLRRVVAHLDALRQRLGIEGYAHVVSANNFPTGTGIASSASAFAALTAAAVSAAGITLSERELTTLARLGSGSASRSIPSGFVQWYAGENHEESFAETIASPDHWDLVDVIAIVSSAHKAVGSSEEHPSAKSSDLQSARVAGAAARLEICKEALLTHNFAAFAEVVELDSNLMHAVMMTSKPPLFYWLPTSLEIMNAVRLWRAEGLQVCYTLDAGPNVHCLALSRDADEVRNRLASLSSALTIRMAPVGEGVRFEPLSLA